MKARSGAAIKTTLQRQANGLTTADLPEGAVGDDEMVDDAGHVAVLVKIAIAAGTLVVDLPARGDQVGNPGRRGCRRMICRCYEPRSRRQHDGPVRLFRLRQE